MNIYLDLSPFTLLYYIYAGDSAGDIIRLYTK